MKSEFLDIEGNPRKLVQEPPVQTPDQESEGSDSEQELIKKQPSVNVTRKSLSVQRKTKKHKGQMLSDMDVIYRKPKRGVPLPIDPRLMGYADMMAQSAAGGWVEESDSEGCSDVYEEVHKMRMDPTFQFYLILGLIVLVLAVVGSVRLHEWVYGKPVIPENTFDFLRKDDEEL